MNISASTFSDPALRSQLQQYYDNKKAAAVESWKARDNDLPKEVKFRGADGVEQTANLIPISAEQMEKAFVSFDKWLEFQAELFDNNGIGPKRLEMAKQQLAHLEEHNPDSSSNVRMTFARDGVLLAYLNADGTLVTSNGSERYLQSIIEKANASGLTGQGRVDYMGREIQNTLARRYEDLEVTSYNNATMPTKRQFADMWYTNFDIDQHYEDALAAAKESYQEANAWHKNWQNQMNEIEQFLLGFQEAA